MKQSTKWEESTWLKDLKIKAALPFEDTFKRLFKLIQPYFIQDLMRFRIVSPK